MSYISKIARPQSDPKIITTGPSSLTAIDRFGRMLGWFGIGLGLVKLLAPRRVTTALGMEGNEKLVRAFGAREIGSGILANSVQEEAGVWSRVIGDGLDLMTLVAALRGNPKRGNVQLALGLVAGITLLDMIGAQGLMARHARRGDWRRYDDRSGFPKGIEKARGAAKVAARG